MRGRTLMLLAAAAGLVTACEDSNDPAPPTTYSATLTGANERPNPVSPAGNGTFNATLGANDILTYTFSFQSLTSACNNAHIHGPIPATGNGTAGVLYDFNAAPTRTMTCNATSGSGQGTIDLKLAVPGTAVTADSFKVLLNNAKLYVNVHSVNNGVGEILGIITRP